MITSEQERTITQDAARRFDERLRRLEAQPDAGNHRGIRIAAARAQLTTLRRELALWDAGIREPIPGTPDPLPATIDAEALTERDAALFFKRAEIANIDRQIGILLDRIADWRRHRAFLEREIADLEAADVPAHAAV